MIKNGRPEPGSLSIGSIFIFPFRKALLFQYANNCRSIENALGNRSNNRWMSGTEFELLLLVEIDLIFCFNSFLSKSFQTISDGYVIILRCIIYT